jgi:DUF4097 and DUF4098 domain-containing protein YvlB
MREERFTTPEPVRLECSVTAGNVTVTTVDGTESTIELDGPQQLIDALRVELVGDRLIVSEQRNSILELLTRSDQSIDVTAAVPAGSSVALKTASSDAVLDGSFKDVDMQSASAELSVSGDIGGDVSVKSASGDVRLPRVRGGVDVRGVSGDLRVESVDRSVTVTTVSGDVRVEAMREGNASVRSVSGDIMLGVEPGSAVDLDATSASGRLTSEVPLSDSPEGGDGPTVVIRAITASGDVRVVRAAPAHLG